MEYIQTILAICGGISIIGGAGAVIVKVIKPAFRLTARVQKLEEHSDKDYKRLVALETMQNSSLRVLQLCSIIRSLVMG